MQSKTSFFNKQLFRKNLTRFWPLWVVPSFVGALLPLAMLTQLIGYGQEGIFGSGGRYALEFTSFYYDVVTYALPILSLCYAILVAIAMWSYLFNSRSTGLMHTLPIRREGLFLTNFLSGMTMMLVPYVVTGALCILISLCYGFFEPVGVLVTILCVIGESLFYFSSATAVAFITGNLFAMPVLYFIFHFLAVGMDQLISVFAGGFLFGLRGDYTGAVEYLSPTVYLMTHVSSAHEYVDVFVPDAAYGTVTPDGVGYYSSELVSVSLENAWIIAVYALSGLVLLALAYALYRKRRSESAGDVVAVGWMKPVFRYGVAICGAMLGGLGLYAVFWGSFQSSDYYDVIPMIVSMLIAGAISYYAASMLLAKSLRVFRGSWKGLGATALCAVAVCCALRFDLFGVETRVPSADQIEYMTLYTADNNYTLYPEKDAELLEEVRAVHLAIAEDADYIKAMSENWMSGGEETFENVSMYNMVRVNYYMKNGTRVLRRYSVPVSQDRLTQEGTYDYALDQLVNSAAMKAERFHLVGGYQPENGYIYLEASNEDGVSFGTKEARAIHEAVRKDVASGTCGNYNWFVNNNRANQYAIDLNLEFEMEDRAVSGQTYSQYDSINITVYPEMTHTVSALLELGLAEPGDLKTYRELYPQEYDEGYLEYVEKCGTSTYDQYVLMKNSASFGVIGGAEGAVEIVGA